MAHVVDDSRLHLVPNLIAEQCKKVASRLAVRQGPSEFTFAELAERTARFRGALTERGIGRGSLVGICIDRTPDLLPLIMAVWQTSAAYVPVDPETITVGRTEAILKDAGCDLVVADSANVDVLSRRGHPSIALSDLAEGTLETDWSHSTLRASDVAYVIYTSGSTGRPKGVAVTHAALTTYVAWAARTYWSDGAVGSLVLSLITFDLAVTSLLVPLLNGQCVELAARGATIPDVLEQLNSTPAMAFLKCTPTHLDVLCDLAEGPLTAPPAHIVVGGEAMYWASVERWKKLAPGARIHNEYGPTEVTVGCVVHEVKDDKNHHQRVPIGRAIPGVEALVLDDELTQLTAPGRGELFLGGPSLALGYRGRGAQTAARFVASPTVTGGRLYRTGDVVERLESGELVYVGRVDDQIKLKGYRIEPAEIEVVLRSHPAVAGCGVVDSDGRHRTLVAFVVLQEPSMRPPTASEIRRFLSSRLPDFMVPTQVQTIAELPLTANGKVDRSRLQAMTRLHR